MGGTFIKKYHESMFKLNVENPSIEPLASGHIIEQIEMIKKLLIMVLVMK